MFDRLERLARSRALLWLIVGAGAVLRVVHYLHDCSLSVDESHLTLNVLDRGFAELLEPLGDRQGAPFGFLFLLKAITLTLGHSEYALRLISLLSGLASLFLFWRLAERWLSPLAVPVGLGLFAIAGNLIFYSAQVKQYSSDVMLALLIYLVSERLGPKPSLRLVALYAVFGAVALWFSHPAVFVLAGVALSDLYFHVLTAKRERPLRVIGAYVFWGVNVLVIYRLSLKSLTEHAWLLDFWSDSFMPFPPKSLLDIQWFVLNFFVMFTKMLGFSLQGIPALALLVGCAAWFRSHRQRLAWLVLPSLLTLLASGLKAYPFSGRLLLFTAPALVLLMAEGTALIAATTRSRPVIALTFAGLLFLHPVMWAGYHVVNPRYEEEIKPEMRYLQENRRPGDVIYIYYRAKPAFRYYAERHGLDYDTCCIHGIDSRYDWNGYERDLEQLRGQPRVWVIFAHIYRWVNVDDESLFLHYLNNMGTEVDRLRTSSAALYLFDLSKPPQRPSVDGLKPAEPTPE